MIGKKSPPFTMHWLGISNLEMCHGKRWPLAK